MNGYDTCKEIKKLIQGHQIQPMSVVAVTADFTAENQQKCLQSGFDQIMSKPLNRKNTEKVLREYLTPLKLPP